MRIEDWFSHIFLINLARRQDRLEHSIGQLDLLGIPRNRVEIFSGYDYKDYGYSPVECCTISHQAILHMASHYRWPRTLMLEDDFEIRSKKTGCQNPIKDDPQELFSAIASEVPADWEVLYLGAQYESRPKERVSKHIIRPNRILCTSSYGVTWQCARKLAPHFHGGAPDTILSNRIEAGEFKVYVSDPRLFRQWNNFSDLEGRQTQGNAMDDIRHVNMVTDE